MNRTIVNKYKQIALIFARSVSGETILLTQKVFN